MEKHYDLVVIGSGSGLSVASAAANQLGWKVAVIEDGPLGGTCLNRGCIPSKIIIHAADIVETIKRSHLFGITSEIKEIDFSFITNRANELVDTDSQKIEIGITKHENMDLYKGKGHFAGNKKIIVNDTTITGEKVLIAAGTRPFVPPIEGIDTVDYWTSTEALRQSKQPQSLIVIGGGYIGMELGHFYGALGTKITIIETLETLLSREDTDISQTFTKLFSEKYSVHLSTKVIKVAQNENGVKVVTTQNASGEEQNFEAEAILVVTGIKSNSDSLSLENTQVKTTDRGFIITNEFMETTEENVWALGDIVGKAPFKHGANYEAEIVLHNMTHQDKRAADYSVMPHAVFTSPQIAGVGLTEQEAKDQGLNYEIKTKEYIKTGMGQAILAQEGFVKFIIDADSNKILGCHIIGPEASTLIHEVIVAMKVCAGDVTAITQSIHIHPALNEVVQRAL